MAGLTILPSASRLLGANMVCLLCVAQIHELCDAPLEGEDKCCCFNEEAQSPVKQVKNLQDFFIGADEGHQKIFVDVLSTGRKRAAIAKPFVEGATCEWARLKYAGGGVKPIIGCAGNILKEARGQYARHHGPDKSVFNNSPENLHLICPTCHNRWHTLNDKYYGDTRPEQGETWLPNVEWENHDSETKATASEIFNNEVSWKLLGAEREENDDTE